MINYLEIIRLGFGLAFVSQVSEKMLVKKFEITQNRSLDAMDDIVNRRKMTEFGNIALVEEREGDHDVTLRLPGVRRGDMASRSFKPEVRVSQLQFSPTGLFFCLKRTSGQTFTLLVAFQEEHSRSRLLRDY